MLDKPREHQVHLIASNALATVPRAMHDACVCMFQAEVVVEKRMKKLMATGEDLGR